MPTIPLRDYVLNNAGAGISNATVTVYPVNSDGTLGASVATQTTGASGLYDFSLDSSVSPTGKFTVKIEAGADVRWRYPDTKLMAERLADASGDAPLLDASIRSAQLKDNSVTDLKIGDRTANQDTTVTAGLTHKLTDWISLFCKTLKSIKGTTNWYDAPATSLAGAKTHIDRRDNPHQVTAAQVGALSTSGGTINGDLTVNNLTVKGTLSGWIDADSIGGYAPQRNQLSGGDLTLTTTKQTVCTLNLGRGVWVVTGTIDFWQIGDNGQTLLGDLWDSISNNYQAQQIICMSEDGRRATVTSVWVLTLTGSAQVKLMAYKTGGSGTSRAMRNHTVLNAFCVQTT